MKNLKSLFVLALSLPLLFGCGSNGIASKDDPNRVYTVRVTHEEYTDTVPDLYAKELAKRVEEKSNGRMKFEIFQVGQLGVGVDLVDHLLTGATQIAIMSPGNIATIIPEGQVFALHYLLPTDVKESYDFLAESKVANTDLPAIYAEKKLKLMDLWPLGGSQWLTKKSIQSPSDFDGMAFRTMDTPLIVKNYEAYNANPTPVSYTDVYSGLQLNMVSGVENPLGALVDMKWYEVQDYLIMSNHIMYLEGVFLSEKYFNSLPKDLQVILSETIDEMHDYAFELQKKANEDAEKLLAENVKVIELSDEQTANFKAAALPVRDYFKKSAGERSAKILEDIEMELEAFNKK